MFQIFLTVVLMITVVGVSSSCKWPGASSPCDFHADFTKPNAYEYDKTGRGVSWKNFASGSESCAGRGVLQLKPPNGTSTLIIDMWLNNPTDWSFHVGDSPSNDGWGGDYGDTWSAAEIHSIKDRTLLYRAFTGKNRAWLMALDVQESVHSGRYTITIKKPTGCGYVAMDNYRGMKQVINDPLLFVWDTMYMGINRVVYRADRSGTGLCSVCIRWS